MILTGASGRTWLRLDASVTEARVWIVVVVGEGVLFVVGFSVVVVGFSVVLGGSRSGGFLTDKTEEIISRKNK